ncbi:hypothetical protein L1987_79430 [Smallanthus sonchifolius]|uniref:Uncharacterized protein n=1 Tax=Smallanthus sonchifolius TaxID=185202 RepID=A0ACB8ZGG5_9ASTR|nr:hypothetical protein L1987_79430 [Smallanthus sonchifolius]
MPHLPESMVEIIINKLTSNRDRNSASLVNKLWYTVDRNSRRTVHVSNCYAVSPARVIDRFPNLRSLTLKGKSGVSNPRLVSNDWDGTIDPWIQAMHKSCPLLEELRLKRMVVSDQNLDMISTCFRNFRSLVLSACFGFTVAGLSAIGSNCSNLEQFEVERSAVTDHTGEWLRCFPETLSSLVSLNISCIKGAVNPTDLARLVARCPNFTTLSLSKTVSVDTIRRILIKSPQLVHLGVGSTLQNSQRSFLQLSLSLHNRESIQSLAFFHRIPKMLVHAFYPVCQNLIFLNVRFSSVLPSFELVNFITKCTNLRRLWVRGGCIGDEGLEVVSNCKNLEDLRVYQGTDGISVTEVGLTAISTGCQKLKSLTYFCSQMTNTALVTFSKNCPNITHFKLIISTPKLPDHTTLQAFDHGFGAIAQSCKELRKLTASGLLTNDVFLYIGMYAERLEVLSVPSGCESAEGMQYVFNGCKNLKKVEINTSSFRVDALLADIYEY